MKTDLHVRVVGAGSPVLVLLHGLGVNGAASDPFLRTYPAGRDAS